MLACVTLAVADGFWTLQPLLALILCEFHETHVYQGYI